jgi:hypothetical protein
MELLVLSMLCAIVVIVLIPNKIWHALFLLGGVLLFGTIAYWAFVLWIVSL